MRNLISFTVTALAVMCLVLLPAGAAGAEQPVPGDEPVARPTSGEVSSDRAEGSPDRRKVPPTVQITRRACSDSSRCHNNVGSDAPPDSIFMLVFAWSEKVTGFEKADLEDEGGQFAGDLVHANQSNSAATKDTFEISFVPRRDDDRRMVTITVPANVAMNGANESNRQAVQRFEVDTRRPTLTSAEVSRDTIWLTYHEALDENYEPALADYVITAWSSVGDATPKTGFNGVGPMFVRINGDRVRLILAEATAEGDSVEVDYTPDAVPVRDAKGNFASALVDQKVTNLRQPLRTPPGRLTDLRATTGTTSITLSWSKPDTGTANITAYEVGVQSGEGEDYVGLRTALNADTTLTYTHSGLTADTTLRYRVRAVSPHGNAAWATVRATTGGTGSGTPGAPTGLTATAAGETAIRLSWTAPSDNGGSAITGYKIEVSNTGTSGWTVLTTVNATSHNHTGLSAGTTRFYRVFAINANGEGPASNTASATTTTASPPDPPRNLRATAANSSQINLTWDAPADNNGAAVTGYYIEVSDDAGSTWTDLVANTGSTATTYPHPGLNPNTTRHYRVSAINSAGTGNPSNVASATTPANRPGRPTLLTATAQGQNQINLKWQAPSDDGGSAITGYRIERSLQRTTGWTVVVANTNATDTEWEDRNLDPGSTRYYRVSAINSSGVGPVSNVATATTDARVPNAPTGLTAKQQGKTSILLRWKASSDDGGAPITGYEIEVTVHLDSMWTVLDTTAAAIPDYLHTGLAPGSTRYYRVSAINSAGKGPVSNVAGDTTPADPPGAPTNLMATANGPTQIDLSWTAPEDNGGADITAYRIWFSVTNGQTWSLLEGSTGSDATTWSDTGLEPATTRHYRVAAINRAGIGPQSDTASAMTDAIPPDPPTELIATKRGTSQIDLVWTPPVNTGGVPLKGYQIEVSADGGSQWEILEANTASLSAKYPHTGLDPASTRHYRVSAINTADLVSEASNVDSATTDATTPDPPTDLTAEADGTSQIDLDWTAPDYDGGADITGYRIEVSTDRGNVWKDLVENTESTATSYEHTGLAPASTRHYRVSAVNRVGPGDPSNTAEATTDATVPNAPLGLTATAKDHSQINLDWDAPGFDGGAAITGYRIEVSADAGTTWTNLVADTDSTVTEYSHTGLNPATTRHYRVSAINEIGTGEPSNVADATTDAIAPNPPTNLEATASAPTRIDLTWSAPLYDGGAPVTGYRIEVSEDGIAWTDLQRNTGVSLTNYAHVGLQPGSTRFYRVSAINVAGTGLPSGVASASTDDPKERAGRVNEAILPHFAAAATTSTLSAIAGRIETVASRNPLRSQLSAAGLLSQAGNMGLRGSGGGLNMARLFDGKSFALPLGGGGPQENVATPVGFTTWGSADYMSMGEPSGEDVEWEGNMLSIHLGADIRVHRDILAGIAGSRSTGDYEFTDMTGGREVAGEYKARMTSLNPYVAWLPGRTGVSAWAAGSFGWGEVTVDDEPGGERASDTRSRGGAVGGTRIMMTRGASALRLRAEGWMSQVEVEGSEGMDSLTLDMQRLRVALEWSQVHMLPGGREVNFLVEGGLRYGDGDGTEGAGMEVGGGLRFISGTRALTVEGHGRVLATGPANYEEWGFRGLIQIDPQAVTRGFSVRIAPAWGQSASGVQELWERGVGDRSDAGQALQRGRVNTRVEYGLGDFGGTPYGRFYVADGGARAFGTGMRYSVTRVLDLRFEGTRTEGAAGPARHGLAMRGRWVF